MPTTFGIQAGFADAIQSPRHPFCLAFSVPPAGCSAFSASFLPRGPAGFPAPYLTCSPLLTALCARLSRRARLLRLLLGWLLLLLLGRLSLRGRLLGLSFI